MTHELKPDDLLKLMHGPILNFKGARTMLNGDSMPFTLESLTRVANIAIRAASTRTASDTRTAALEEAAKACEAEAVEKTGTLGDSAYNDAISDCAKAIRALALAAGEAECDAALVRAAPASQHDAALAALKPFADSYAPEAARMAKFYTPEDVARYGAQWDANTITPPATMGDFRRAYDAYRTASTDAASRSREDGGNTCNEPGLLDASKPAETRMDTGFGGGQLVDVEAERAQCKAAFGPSWTVHSAADRANLLAGWLKKARTQADAGKDRARLNALIDWYLRGGNRAEIHPYGHIEFTTREHIIAWCDAQSPTTKPENI